MEPSGLDELLERACRREPAALDELVCRYSRRVFGLLYRLTNERETAEDLMQETFLRVVRTIDRYEHAGRFEAWLFRIAANLARDRARRRGRRGDTLSLDGAEDDGTSRAAELSAPAQHADQLLVEAELGERLAASLDRLSDADREIILLRHYSELSFQEIADLLGVPLGTALARAHRALKRLQADLGEES